MYEPETVALPQQTPETDSSDSTYTSNITQCDQQFIPS